MIRLKNFALLMLLLLPFQLLFADEIEDLAKTHPSVLLVFSGNTGKSVERNINFTRTEYINRCSSAQAVVNDKGLLVNDVVVPFLNVEQSNKEPSLGNLKSDKSPLIFNRWDFTIEADGKYCLYHRTEIGTYGFLDQDRILVLTGGVVSIENSGALWVNLKKGKHSLVLAKTHSSNQQLLVVSEEQGKKIAVELQQKISTYKPEDYTWVLSEFLPYVSGLQNGAGSHFCKILKKLNQTHALEKTKETNNFLRLSIPMVYFYHDHYIIEKFIFENFPDIYFFISKNTENAKYPWVNVLINNGRSRTVFYQSLIYDGQKELADKYFEKAIATLNNLNDLPEKEKIIAGFYADRLTAYFRFGRIREANEIYKSTNEFCKVPVLERFKDNKPEQEDVVTLTQSFYETNAFQLKELVETYEGKPDQLPSMYKAFVSANNNLVKANDGAISLFYLFQLSKNKNEKLLNDFPKYILEKIQTQIDKAKETRDIKLCEELIEQNEINIALPEIRLILLDEYFKNGFYLKALSQANYLFDKYPQQQSAIVTKLALLENLCDIPLEKRKPLNDSLQKVSFKIAGNGSNVGKLSGSLDKSIKEPGKFLKMIALEPLHVQYTNHPQINYYQPIEPLFLNSGFILNGGSYLFGYSATANDVVWRYRSEFEYKKENENGPHQKQFTTLHAGNQLFTLINRDFSEKKTVKSFDLKGNLIWDMSDQKASLAEEPYCTPIEAQGKLFCLTYSNRETINTVSYAVYNSVTGDLISRTPISLLPSAARDDICRNVGLKWNTYTHDNHFIKDDLFVYGYSGTGVLFKADANSGNLLWEKGFPKTSISSEYTFWIDNGFAPSGYIQLYGDVLLTFMPDVQAFIGVSKVTGEVIWKTKQLAPKFIHNRFKSDYLYFSSETQGVEPNLFKINPKTGELLWKVSTNGLLINGEGELYGNKLYLPVQNAIAIFNVENGELLQQIPLKFQPIKIRANNEYTLIFSADNVFVFKNSGSFEPSQLPDPKPNPIVSKFVEPETKPKSDLSIDNLKLELTLKLPEAYYASGDPWKKTKLLKTSKPFHFILECKEHVSLFREGYSQADGKYVPPEILWYGQYVDHVILDDVLYASESGSITAYQLFTREKIWTYEYDSRTPVIKGTLYKTPTALSVTKQYIAYQSGQQSICVLELSTRKKVLEFYSPTCKYLLMEGSYVITVSSTGFVRCFDINQGGKEIWVIDHNHYFEAGLDQDKFVFIRNNSSTISYYDLKTGKEIFTSSSFNRNLYTMNNYYSEGNYLFAYDWLYDVRTGKPFDRWQEAAKVTGGGFICFNKQFGAEGCYLTPDGKEYAFVTQCERGYNNKLFTAVRKQNRLVFFSSWGIEAFDIVGDKLVSIDFIKYYSGPSGNWEGGTSLFPLDDSLIMVRNDEMYFYKNFDSAMNYEKINSCRVENKKNFNWPTSEVYPEIELGEKNWISYFGEKPKRKLFYQAFGDEKYAYLKFKVTPKTDVNSQCVLYISGNGFDEVFAITWDVDNWRSCQYTFNIKDIVESWKEVDIQGNLLLYIKMLIKSPLPREFKNTLPDFNIELREKTGLRQDGMYRIGGAYFKNRKFFPWLIYLNDEAQTMRDFNIRNQLYEKNVNFYPPGDDLYRWVKDRRRFKSVDNNISFLQKMLTQNVKYYCSVNILTTLLLEEIQSIREKNPGLLEVSDEFSAKLVEKVKSLSQFALDKGMNKEWVDFALSFYAIEVFPAKINYNFSRHDFFKALHGVVLRSDKESLIQNLYREDVNILTPNVNIPYLEWVFPGLSGSFPTGKTYSKIDLHQGYKEKTFLGRMNFYSTNGKNEFCNNIGKFANEAAKINLSEKDKYEITSRKYFYNGVSYNCFFVSGAARGIFDLSFDVPTIKSPTVISDTGLTINSISTALENLPSDNTNGLELIEYYFSLKKDLTQDETNKIYAMWLSSIKDNGRATYQAIKKIHGKLERQSNRLEILAQIFREAKLSPKTPRNFLVDYYNKLMDTKSRSVFGPCFQELSDKPEKNPLGEFKEGNKVWKFTDEFEKQKGGFGYMAFKVNATEKEKAFLYATAGYNGTVTFSIYLNGETLCENENLLNYDDNLIVQKISLNKGENIVVIRINNNKEASWNWQLKVNFGDIYGMPLKDVEMKPLHK